MPESCQLGPERERAAPAGQHVKRFQMSDPGIVLHVGGVFPASRGVQCGLRLVSDWYQDGSDDTSL